jgi:UDP-3-O-acyl N-acetylglucosamine deacetylase
LARAASVRGFGFWSSLDVELEFCPAPPNSGIVFVRTDLPGSPAIAGSIDFRVDAPRRTNLACQGVRVEMVEHVMAALSGLRVDNCQIRCSSAEMPGPDGSSRRFVEALLSAGIVAQDAPARVLQVDLPLEIREGDAWVAAEPCDGFHIAYELDYGPGPIGKQSFAEEITPELFVRELAPARTFILESEAQWLRSQGLALRASTSDLLVFDEQGPQGNPLRFPNECVRHKALDMVGDLALAGCRLQGRFSASRSGHRLNSLLLRQLRASHAKSVLAASR